MKFGSILVYAIVFFVGLAVSRGFMTVTYSGHTENISVYEHFYTSNEGLHSSSRQCGNSNDLSDRHQLRKGFWKIKTEIYSFANKYFGYTGVGASFYLIHAMAILVMFYFLYKTTLHIVLQNLSRNPDNGKVGLASDGKLSILAVCSIIFLALLSYVFNGHVGEYSYSVFEALFISIGFYSALKRRILLFIIATSFAVLNRESGFLLILVWIIINGIDFNRMHRSAFLLVPALVFLSVNIDIMHCVIRDGFLVSSKPLPGQLTFHIFTEGTWGVVRGLVAIMFNYGLLFIPIIFLHFRFSSLISDASRAVINKIFLIIGIYTLVFLFATPLNHMSVKFIIVPFVLPLLSLYVLGLLQKGRVNLWNAK